MELGELRHAVVYILWPLRRVSAHCFVGVGGRIRWHCPFSDAQYSRMRMVALALVPIDAALLAALAVPDARYTRLALGGGTARSPGQRCGRHLGSRCSATGAADKLTSMKRPKIVLGAGCLREAGDQLLEMALFVAASERTESVAENASHSPCLQLHATEMRVREVMLAYRW
jgi:hypothetical protein